MDTLVQANFASPIVGHTDITRLRCDLLTQHHPWIFFAKGFSQNSARGKRSNQSKLRTVLQNNKPKLFKKEQVIQDRKQKPGELPRLQATNVIQQLTLMPN